jgi:hypothetical protein
MISIREFYLGVGFCAGERATSLVSLDNDSFSLRFAEREAPLKRAVE